MSNWIPSADNAYSLGQVSPSLRQWKNLYLASGGGIYIANDCILSRYSGAQLQIAGTGTPAIWFGSGGDTSIYRYSAGVLFCPALTPNTDNSYDLGMVSPLSFQWRNLYLASGGSVYINGAKILNQALLTTSSPTFLNLTLTGAITMTENVDASFLNLTNSNATTGYSMLNLNESTSGDWGTITMTTSRVGLYITEAGTKNPIEVHVGSNTIFKVDVNGKITTLNNVSATGTITASSGIISDYLSGAYGAAWGSLPTFPTGTNGMSIVLWNTDTSTGRTYTYANGGWHYTAMT